MLSSHLTMPQESHLEELCHVFMCLKKHIKSEMVFDPSEPEVDLNEFPRQDLSYSIYSSPGEELKGMLPPDMPEPLGNGFTGRCFIYADHAGNVVTRNLRTEFVVMLKNTPVYLYSKKEGSVETSTFGSEFIARKQAAEHIQSLRYTLRMFGIPVDGPVFFIFGENQSILVDTVVSSSTLKTRL